MYLLNSERDSDLDSFALVRTSGFGGMREAWLMIKHRDGYCIDGYDAADYDFSAVSGLSLAQILEKTG